MEYKINEQEYGLINTVLRQVLNLCQTVSYPAVFTHFDQDGKEVKRPKDEDIALGKVMKVMDEFKTFKEDNLQVTYDGSKITKEMLLLGELLADLRVRDIEVNIEKES